MCAAMLPLKDCMLRFKKANLDDTAHDFVIDQPCVCRTIRVYVKSTRSRYRGTEVPGRKVHEASDQRTSTMDGPMAHRPPTVHTLWAAMMVTSTNTNVELRETVSRFEPLLFHDSCSSAELTGVHDERSLTAQSESHLRTVLPKGEADLHRS